ncbi:MAG: amidase [Acidimicrobiales bacterium]
MTSAAATKKAADAVWIERFAPAARPGVSAAGPSVAVKDLIDVEGSVTTAGCRAVAERAGPAADDAACIKSIRRGGGWLAGKVNLHELAFGVSGVNPWYGMPANPADPGRIPGGSSSGSAVAVALGEVDIALGSDSGGSVRIPAACCGIVGLKTTYGRLPLDGVWPLAPSFDTIGPMAASVAGVVEAMRLLEGEFTADRQLDTRVCRAELGPEVEVDPVIGSAIDSALQTAELEVEALAVEGWLPAWKHQQLLLSVEALASNGWLVEESNGAGIGEETLQRLRNSRVDASSVERAQRAAHRWVSRFVRLVEEAGVLALPTLAYRPPRPGERFSGFNLMTAPVNLAGLPAISIPVPAPGRPPAGLQLVAPRGREELLVVVAARIEAAVDQA